MLLLVGCFNSNADNAEGAERVAPVLELTNFNNEVLDTGTIDKPILYSFWASWCGFCAQETPILDGLYKTYNDQVEFVSINLTTNDTVNGARRFIENNNLQMPVYLDLDGIASTSLRILGVPAVVLVDQAGNIVYHRIGPVQDPNAYYTEKIEELLSQAESSDI
jgi:thiol-disulfide isomerase/thioredoxin